MIEGFTYYPISTVDLLAVWEHILNVNDFDMDVSRLGLDDYLFFWSEGFGAGWW